MISIENGFHFNLKTYNFNSRVAPFTSHLFYFCVKELHVLKPARFASLFFWNSAWRSGRVGQAQSRCYSHLSAALLPFSFFFLLFTFGKEATMTTLLPFLHLVFAFRLHQSSSPSSSNMHAVPWSLVSLQFACKTMQNYFSSSKLTFFLFNQIVTETFF